MQGLHHQIGPGRQGTHRQTRLAEVGPMGFIHQHRQAVAVGHRDQTLQISRQALVGGMHQHQRRQGWGLLQAPPQPGGAWRQPQSGGRIEGEIEQHRPQTAQHAGVQQAAVQVARQQHPLAGLGQSQQGHLQHPAGSVHPEPAAIGPAEAGDSAWAAATAPLRFQRPSDLGQFRQIPAAGAPPQQPAQARRQAPAAPMGGQVQIEAREALTQGRQQEHHQPWTF